MFKNCLMCGNEIKVKPSAFKSKKFCSNKCKYKMMSTSEYIKNVGTKQSFSKMEYDINSIHQRIESLSSTSNVSGIKRTLTSEGFKISEVTIRKYMKRWGIRPAIIKRTISEERRKRQSLALKGRKHSDEHNRKVREKTLARGLLMKAGLIKYKTRKGYKSSEITKQRLSESHKGKIPTSQARKKQSIHFLGYDIEKHKDEILSKYALGISAKRIAKDYGTYGPTIIRWLKKWGATIGNSIFPHKIKHNANDGHILLSSVETIIDEYLHRHRIKHIVNRQLLETKYRYDFYLPEFNVYIEYWGLDEIERYKRKRELKEAIYRDNNLKLIGITPNENPIKKIEMELELQPKIEDFVCPMMKPN